MAALFLALQARVKKHGDDVAVTLHRALVNATPKQSGRLRAGWSVVLNIANVAQPAAPYRSRTPAEVRRALKNRRPEQNAVVVNPVPYGQEVHDKRPFIPRAMSIAARRGS